MAKRSYERHGMTGTRIHNVWRSMKQRCQNKRNHAYADYGGRGITLCDEWQSFEAFYRDMGPSYKEGLELDRINNDLGYSKDNCRWTTRSTQNRNQRKQRDSTSKYIGVWRVTDKWRVQYSLDNKKRHVGYYDTEDEAAAAYQEAIKDLP